MSNILLNIPINLKKCKQLHFLLDKSISTKNDEIIKYYLKNDMQ